MAFSSGLEGGHVWSQKLRLLRVPLDAANSIYCFMASSEKKKMTLCVFCGIVILEFESQCEDKILIVHGSFVKLTLTSHHILTEGEISTTRDKAKLIGDHHNSLGDCWRS